jgi:chemotaxis signal transduction protein
LNSSQNLFRLLICRSYLCKPSISNGCKEICDFRDARLNPFLTFQVFILPKQIILVRVGSHLVGLDSAIVRKVMDIQELHHFPLQRNFFNGAVLYQRKFVPSLMLDGFIGIGLYSSVDMLRTDATVFLEQAPYWLCFRVNEIRGLVTLEQAMPADKATCSPDIDYRYVQESLSLKQDIIYILNIERIVKEVFEPIQL